MLYEWDFDGDGVYDYSGIDPVTEYAYPAVYNPDGSINWDATTNDYAAILRVTDDTPPASGGPLTDVDARIVHITAPPWKPVADPNGPYNARIEEPVDLDGSKSYDPESVMYPPDHPWYETIASYDWDLDNDGEFDDASGPIVSWSWPAEGTYLACLRVTDSSPSVPGGPFTDLDVDTKCTVVIVSSIHDVAVESIDPSTSNPIIGEAVAIDVAVSNLGDFTESFDVTLHYDGQIIGLTNVTGLTPGGDELLQFSWDTTGVPEGSYIIKACADSVPGEIIVGNNCLETTVQVWEALPVSVDIKPGSDPNCIKKTSKGNVPVAILSTSTIDLSTIVINTIEIDNDADAMTPGVSPKRSSLRKDVDGDGSADLVLHFSTVGLDGAGLLVDGNTLYITGELLDETPIVGSDVIYLAGGPNCLD